MIKVAVLIDGGHVIRRCLAACRYAVLTNEQGILTMQCEYVVTGGTGFIGNELVRQLQRQGKAVAVLDNGSRVAPQIDDLRTVPLYEVDIVDHRRVASLLPDLKPRVVFHLAAIHFIPECNANPERTLRVNVEATLGLLRACSSACAA